VTDVPACTCITCSDQAVPMRILQLDAERGLALCEAADGERRSVEVALLAEAAPGDTVLVHADVAIAAEAAA
jgi:hydrogenase expression/formation protein HypC